MLSLYAANTQANESLPQTATFCSSLHLLSAFIVHVTAFTSAQVLRRMEQAGFIIPTGLKAPFTAWLD